MSGPVLLLGAGATKACGGPLTDEILPLAFTLALENSRLAPLEDFLIDVFHLPADRSARQFYPSLPLLLSLIDTSLMLEAPLSVKWPISGLREVRASVEYTIFTVIAKKLFAWATYHRHLLETIFTNNGRFDHEPVVVSLNYDILVDNALIEVTGASGFSLPRYGCNLEVDRQPVQRYGALLKLHGSLNWSHCPGCHRLRISTIDKGANVVWTQKVTDLYERNHVRNCERCSHELRPVLVSPTLHKSYVNPHIQSIWYEAERRLHDADAVYFIGYSLPPEDVAVIHLLKRGAQHLPPNKLTVVEFDPDGRGLMENPVGRRYASLFGSVNWSPLGLEGWLEERGAFSDRQVSGRKQVKSVRKPRSPKR